MNLDFIIIHGAPGTGKTTICRKLHERLQSPYFEFGWIPEFRMYTPSLAVTQKDEEQLSFENLVLVVKNYQHHGYRNIIMTDLDDRRMLDIPAVFEGYRYVIITLYSDQEDVLKQRIAQRSNGNEFKDWQMSLNINTIIRGRKPLPNEYRLLNTGDDAEVAFQQVLTIIEQHMNSDPSRSSSVWTSLQRSEYKPEHFFTYIQDE